MNEFKARLLKKNIAMNKSIGMREVQTKYFLLKKGWNDSKTSIRHSCTYSDKFIIKIETLFDEYSDFFYIKFKVYEKIKITNSLGIDKNLKIKIFDREYKNRECTDYDLYLKKWGDKFYEEFQSKLENAIKGAVAV